ncbi:MAG TPA: hypothetical protein PLV91_08125 [Verrucomicrobiota bacterium]|nr:hypothetical protein [Verrucomicrobiota bacterium]
MVNAVTKRADISKRRYQKFRGEPVGKYDSRALIGVRSNPLIRSFSSFAVEAFRSLFSNCAGFIFKVKREAPTIIGIGEIRMRITMRGNSPKSK